MQEIFPTNCSAMNIYFNLIACLLRENIIINDCGEVFPQDIYINIIFSVSKAEFNLIQFFEKSQ